MRSESCRGAATAAPKADDMKTSAGSAQQGAMCHHL